MLTPEELPLRKREVKQRGASRPLFSLPSPPAHPLFFPALYENRPAHRLSGAPTAPDYRLQYLIYHCLSLSLSLSLLSRSAVWKSLGKPGGDCLRKKGRRYWIYLLYWYKSTNTDAAGCSGASIRRPLSLLALLVQKYKYWRDWL